MLTENRLDLCSLDAVSRPLSIIAKPIFKLLRNNSETLLTQTSNFWGIRQTSSFLLCANTDANTVSYYVTFGNMMYIERYLEVEMK